MIRRLSYILLLIVVLQAETLAQGMVIETWSGEQKVELLEPIEKIGFPGAFILVELDNETSNSYNLYNVRRIYFDPSAGMGASEFEKAGLHVYPNPASDIVRIGGVSGEVLVHVYSVSGKQLLFKVLSSHEQGIDISFLEPGIYIAIINNQAVKFVKK